MDEQHRYEINLKQGDLFINLSSEDVLFVSKQMDKWCRILMDDSYIPIVVPPSKLPPEPQQAPVVPQQAAPPVYEAPPQPVYAQPQQYAPQPALVPAGYQQAPPPAYVQHPQFQQMAYAQQQPAPQQYPGVPQQPYPQQQLPLDYYQQQQQQQAYQQPAPAPVNVQPPAPQQAPPAPSAPSMPEALPELPPILQAAVPPQPEPEASSPQDAFENVMDSLMKEFDEESESAGSPVAVAPASNGFSKEGLPPNLSAELPTATSLLELCDRAHADSSEDYLLLSAYYLTFFERQSQFSLKKVNAMLVKSGLTPVNHSVLESTLGRGYLSMVPDLTGTAEVSEYVLTGEGQQAVKQLFG